jgi:hypothetical protein
MRILGIVLAGLMATGFVWADPNRGFLELSLGAEQFLERRAVQ